MMTMQPAAASGLGVPFLNLALMHAPIKDAIVRDVDDLLESGAFTNGHQVRVFEEAFADYCRTTRCVGVASGLDGLRLALLAGGLKRGGEVIVPAATFVASVEAITQAGGVPVLVDSLE